MKYIIQKHAGQVDKQGEDYFTAHLNTVGWICYENAYVAYGHDLLEDTDATVEEMREVGFTEDEIADIQRLTKRKGEDLYDYAQRVRESDVALKVKIADVMSNVSRVHSLNDPQTEARLLDKYHKTLYYLSGGGR